RGVDLLIGPYGSGLVRAVAPLVCDAGRLLWNHGGAADDLARPGLVSLPAPASSYFEGAVREAAARRAGRLPGGPRRRPVRRRGRPGRGGTCVRTGDRGADGHGGLAGRRRRRRRGPAGRR